MARSNSLQFATGPYEARAARVRGEEPWVGTGTGHVAAPRPHLSAVSRLHVSVLVSPLTLLRCSRQERSRGHVQMQRFLWARVLPRSRTFLISENDFFFFLPAKTCVLRHSPSLTQGMFLRGKAGEGLLRDTRRTVLKDIVWHRALWMPCCGPEGRQSTAPRAPLVCILKERGPQETRVEETNGTWTTKMIWIRDNAAHRVTSTSNSTCVCLSSLFLRSGPEANYFCKSLDNSR